MTTHVELSVYSSCLHQTAGVAPHRPLMSHLDIIGADVGHAVCQQLLKQGRITVASRGQGPRNVGHTLRTCMHSTTNTVVSTYKPLTGHQSHLDACYASQ
jgi:hypothetical protein